MLKRPVLVGRARIAVICEHHAMADERFILDDHTLANEAVRGDFAPPADAHPLLNLDEWADAGPGADAAAIEIYQVRMADADIFLEDDRFADGHERAPLFPASDDACLTKAKDMLPE